MGDETRSPETGDDYNDEEARIERREDRADAKRDAAAEFDFERDCGARP